MLVEVGQCQAVVETIDDLQVPRVQWQIKIIDDLFECMCIHRIVEELLKDYILGQKVPGDVSHWIIRSQSKGIGDGILEMLDRLGHQGSFCGLGHFIILRQNNAVDKTQPRISSPLAVLLDPQFLVSLP